MLRGGDRAGPRAVGRTGGGERGRGSERGEVRGGIGPASGGERHGQCRQEEGNGAPKGGECQHEEAPRTAVTPPEPLPEVTATPAVTSAAPGSAPPLAAAL